MGYGEPKRKVGRPATGHLSSSDRHTVVTNRLSMVPRRQCADPARRARLETDDESWLRWYCGDTYYLPFEKPHKAIIENARLAMTTGEDACIAAERGIGKSFLLYGMTFKYAITGEQAFPVYIPWSEKEKEQGFNFWMDGLCNNQRMADDYPEVCDPFAHAQGVSQRIMTTTWEDTGERTGARSLISKGLIIFPDGRGVIGSSSMGGNPRGMHYKAANERPIRPTMALIDDIQDDKVAHSPDGVAKTIRKVNGAIRGLKRAGSTFSILMSGNCICTGDVMDHFLNQSGWNCVRVACVDRWPVDWDNPQKETRRLLDEWGGLFKTGTGEVTFYRKNRKVMTTGMVITSPRWYKESKLTQAGDKRNKMAPPVDCCHGVLRDYYRMGHEAFMAERQQSPVDPVAEAEVRVMPDMILKRAIGPARGVVPPGSINVVAGADINPGISGRLGARITWAASAFQMHQGACVIAYGIHNLDMPPNPTPSQQVSVVYAGLNHIRMMLGGMGVEALVYDARGWYNKGVTRGQALRYAMIPFPSSQVKAIPAEGWPHEAYRPTHKTAVRAFEGCHLSRDRIEQQVVTWIAWDSDWHHLQQLRSWLAAPGAPGSCILHGGHHDGEFLQQITRRAFVGMVQKHSGPVYDWKSQPGNDDYDDCLAMCRVGAAYFGIGTGGAQKPATTKATVLIHRPGWRR